MSNSISKLAYHLCSIPSISGSEGDVLLFLTSWLAEHGFSWEKIPVSGERYNIFAYRTPHPVFSVILCTHVDTVAPFVKPMLDDEAGILWGRGSCDAKGIAATMIYAALAEFADGHDDIALLFTVGEEEASDGAKACMPELGKRARFIVVGEPTELKAAYAQKGCLVFDLKAAGREAHSSQPELGDSAIHKLVKAMERVLSHRWPSDPQFGDTFVNFGVIEGGSMRNVFAKEATTQCIMRTSTQNDPIIDEIKQMLPQGVSMAIKSSGSPFMFHVPHDFAEFFATFGSDAPYLREVGNPMLIGPGSLRYAHRPDEQISYHELELGVNAYRKIAHYVRKSFKF